MIDCAGELSDEIDLVIFDGQYSPLLFKQHGVLYVPAESVYAVLEVRPEMNGQNLVYAGQKAASVRRLRRTSVTIPHAGGEYAPRDLYEIRAGLVCLESGWSCPFGKGFIATMGRLKKDGRLHFGCCLRHGAFRVSYTGKAQPKMHTCGKDTALIFFLLSLFSALQRLGTAPAIDVWAYAGTVAK